MGLPTLTRTNYMFGMKDSVVSNAFLLVRRWSLRMLVVLSLGVACEAQCPTFSDYASDVVTINMRSCGLTALDTAELTRFTLLRNLLLSTNQLTTFPNVSAVGKTLMSVDLGFNLITHISDDALLHLTSLESLFLNGNRLTKVPNLPAALSALKTLDVTDNLLMSDGVSDDAFAYLINMEDMYLDTNLNLTRFPHPAQGLRRIQWLYLFDTGISHLPPILHENIATLELKIQGSVDVCKCENAWLKQEGPNMVNFVYDDADCDGQLWSTMTVQDMIAKCSQERRQKTKQMSQARSVPTQMSLSPFLLHSYQRALNEIRCTMKCMATPGCVSYWHKLEDLAGDCVLIAPGNSISVSSVPEGDLPVWTYFALT